ncbi:hypothetical protein ABZX90_31920 [Streptomyces sp. NPDC002935]|uniref:hypothetical protein n=1 Tax=Streptomyces sp. NPDC002935 TaxID=3154545 RepID=UPI0033B2CF2F
MMLENLPMAPDEHMCVSYGPDRGMWTGPAERDVPKVCERGLTWIIKQRSQTCAAAR